MQRSFSKEELFVEPSGRLGNQLFQLAACHYILKTKNKADWTLNWIGKSDYEILLRSLSNFEINFIDQSFKFDHNRKLDRAIYKLNRMVLNFRFEVITSVEHIKMSNNNFKKIYLNGYFQDYTLVKPFLDSWREKIDENFEIPRELKRMSQNVSTVAIHFRFTDFLDKGWKNEWGNLSTDFYSESLRKIARINSIKNLFIFSDDYYLARQVIKGMSLTKEINLFQAKEFCKDDVSEFILLSKFKNKIISNSTFSWWAGYLSPINSQVISPSPITKNLLRQNAISPQWRIVPANYLVC